MAADNNKNSASDEKAQTPAVKVGGGGNAAPVSQIHMDRKELFWALFIVLVLLIGGLLVASKFHIGSKVYAQAAGHKVYKKDIDAIKVNNKSISDNTAATTLANKYLAQAMAQEQGITVSAADIARTQCPGQKANPFGYQTCVNQLYFTKLGDKNEGIYKGEALVANFSRYIPYPSPLLEKEKALNPKIGDPAAIAADKAYAKAFITGLYNQIVSGKISFDQAIQMEHNDPQVGVKAYPSLVHSGTFNGRISQDNLISADSIRQKMANMKAGEITKPFAPPGPKSLAADGTASGTDETYFLVVKMDRVSGGHGKTSFDQELQQAKKKLGYKVNV